MSRIMIVGSGVVGRATGQGFIEHGNDVTFVDIDERVVAGLGAQGRTAIFPADIELAGVAAVFVAVTAPTAPDGIDLSYLEQACKSLGAAIAECCTQPVVVFRCTIPPGTTRTRLVPLLEGASGKKAGIDFGVCYNPEYLRAHCAERDFLHPRIVTIGRDPWNDESTRRVAGIYAGFGAPVYECSYEEAEFQKYVHNLFNAAKVSFFNEMRLAAENLGLDPRQAFHCTALSAQGMWDSMYGCYDDGPYSGACLPKDVGAWLRFAQDRGIPAPILTAVREVNRVRGGA